MPWIDRKENWMPRTPPPAPIRRPVEQMYSVLEVAHILSVSKATVYKWLALDAPEEAVIHPDDWLKLPGSGHIRIFERAIVKLQAQLT